MLFALQGQKIVNKLDGIRSKLFILLIYYQNYLFISSMFTKGRKAEKQKKNKCNQNG